MIKAVIVSFLLLSFFSTVKANHITGGELFYTYNGMSNGLHRYNVTLKLFMRCNSGRTFNNPAIISVFSKSTNTRIKDITVQLGQTQTLELNNPNRCISNPPIVCYLVGYYEFSVEVPPSPDGYIIAGQFVYRIAGITNMQGSGNIGTTYTGEIPGTSTTANGMENNSAKFVGSDLVVVCANNDFSYSFAAVDNDRDRLLYSFCIAYQGGSGGNGNTATPAMPPYQSIPYSGEYSGSSPLGSEVKIDQRTGLITGKAPATAGTYVVTVCVQEIRDGVVIATQRKDIQINVAPCSVVAAQLQPEYMLCRDTKTITLSNRSRSELIKTQYWELSNTNGASLFTSVNPTISFAFPDTGIYRIKLVINRGQECSDSATAITRVYPGFTPAFNSSGVCFNKQTSFTDATTTVYGVVNSWNWDFGESNVARNFSAAKDPTIQYSSMGSKNVRLVVGNSVGCVDTIAKYVTIIDKPPIALAFRDTLVCIKDPLQLKAIGNGKFSWAPSVNMANANSAEPSVNPESSTTYFVDLNDDGCLNRDSVKVRVTDHVDLTTMKDTTICKSDPMRLNIKSNGFTYSWTPAGQVVNPTQKNPLVITNATTTYQVTAAIGGCSASKQIVVTTVPYPLAYAGPDTTICFNTSVRLHAKTDGSSFKWSPAAALSSGSVLQPEASPAKTTSFGFYAYGDKGCPKPGIDSVVVTVLPVIRPSAGRDTTVVTGQPLQLSATGGVRYLWLPATGLSAADIATPVALFNEPSEGRRYKVLVFNEAGCMDSASVNVKVFETAPSVFLPNAFTPNRDGRNDVFRPIAAGMQKIEYFRIYNRWGQLIFTSGDNGKGWDGTVGGRPQDEGVFIWMVKAVDFKGTPFFKKGSVVLIR